MAHAVKSAGEGKKTLRVSTDMAHNLGDILGLKLGKEAETVLPNPDHLSIGCGCSGVYAAAELSGCGRVYGRSAVYSDCCFYAGYYRFCGTG